MFCMYVRTFDVFKEDKGMSTKKKETRETWTDFRWCSMFWF